ncbi:MAG: glucosaminidase domain-containing protein [Chitinophagaceae bacterium]
MKKLFFLILFFSTTGLLFSQKEKAIAYIEKYRFIAMQEMQRTGVPAAITLAQGILESAMGESVLCKKSNNHFGIKCKTEWTGEKVYHDDDASQECFRKYNSPEESFKDHSDFLKNRPYYASLFKLDVTDYESWAVGLQKSGYATEKNYPQLLIKVINDYNLNQYTLFALNNNLDDSIVKVDFKTNESNVITDVPKLNATSARVENKNYEQKLNTPKQTKPSEDLKLTPPKTTTVIDDEKEDEEVKINTEVKKTAEANLYPQGIFTINNAKVIYVSQGTSLLSLALEHNISLAKILEYNDLAEMEFTDVDRLIYIEKKLKKGNADFYIVQPNEDLHYISQKLGIQLQALAELNGIHKKLNPLVGEKLYLRVKSLVPPKVSMASNSEQNTKK